MDQTLKQLGELLLGAVPTVILLALLYAFYTTIVHRPLRRVLEELLEIHDADFDLRTGLASRQ